MEGLFLHFLNASLAATPLVLAVMAARLALKKAPRWIICLMWAVAAIRLLLPQLPPSPVGIGTAAPVAAITQTLQAPTAVQPQAELSTLTGAAGEVTAVPAVIDILTVAAWVWLLGVLAMLLYLLLSCLRLRLSVREAVPLENRVFLCDSVTTPFILGILRPGIYLPSHISQPEQALVLLHERSHLSRRDHWWKPLGFLLLSLCWFHPIMWLAYGLLCRDLELACDEKVAKTLDASGKKAYSMALLNWSAPTRLIRVCPLAFGEVAVKARVRHVLHYKKPGFWRMLLTVAALILGAVCFLTTGQQEPSDTAPPAQTQPSAEIPAEAITQPAGNPTSLTFLTHGFGTLADSRAQDFPYSGSQVCIPYHMVTSTQQGMILLVNGQPQPYRLSETGELAYMHRFSEFQQAELWFTPVTGKPGDTLSLLAFNVNCPDYREGDGQVSFPLTASALPAFGSLTLQASPENAAAPQASRILSHSMTTREGNLSQPETAATVTLASTQRSPLPDGSLPVRVSMDVPTSDLWTLTLYVNNIPAAGESIQFSGEEGRVIELNYVLDLQDLTDTAAVYAVLASTNPENRDAKASNTIFISAQ